MERRGFLAASCAASLASLASVAGAAQSNRGSRGPRRDCYELRQYVLETDKQKAGFDEFMSEAAIPALNRVGVEPVGVFFPMEGISPAYVLLRHSSVWSLMSSTRRLLDDQEYLSKGAKFLDAPAEDPAYKRMTSSVLLAFEGMTKLEIPSKKDTRILQLRTYESPSVKTGQKKIEMFNTAEIAVFRKVGLNPVFFGEAIAGEKMPNLTYMLGFDNMDERKEAWKRFGADPDWQKLRAMPEYADKKILCGITNTFLTPAPYSQV